MPTPPPWEAEKPTIAEAPFEMVVGATYAAACILLDEGRDLRKMEAPEFLDMVRDVFRRVEKNPIERLLEDIFGDQTASLEALGDGIHAMNRVRRNAAGTPLMEARREPAKAEPGSEPADDAPDAPIEPRPGGGWDQTLAADCEEFAQLDALFGAFLSPLANGIGDMTAEDVDDRIFVEFFNRVGASSHRDMVENGFWEDPGAMKAREALDTLGALTAAHGTTLYGLPSQFSGTLERLAAVAHDRADQPPRNDLADLMLMVTEIAEAAEGGRKNANAPDDKIPDFTIFEAELADVVLRIMDFAGGRDLRVAEAIVAKKAFNRTRPRKHGKTC